MDLMKDLREIIINQFEINDISYISTEDIHPLLLKYLNVCSKIIKPIPRNVFISEELKYKKLSRKINVIFDEIKIKFEKGYNVNPYLSKKLFDSDFDDLLLHSWKIHHLHLSNQKINDSDLFFERSDYLLFCMVRENDVYFIDILPHAEDNVFFKREVPKILNRNWPDILEYCKLQGIEKGATYNDEEIKQLRQSGINSPLEMEGGVFMPIAGGGLSLAKTNINIIHYRHANSLIKSIKNVEKQIITNNACIRDKISKTIPSIPDNLEFHLFLDDRGFIVKEINTNICITFP